MTTIENIYENGNGFSLPVEVPVQPKTVTKEGPKETLKRIAQRRIDNAKQKLDLLINTFNQNYPFSEEHIELVERLLNDCLEELQYTKAARKLRQKTKRYEV